METKQIAKNIRKELKENCGYTNQQVSVKTRTNQSIDIIIKDFSVSYKDIEQISNKYEEYQTDEVTGEILNGGNTFIFIKCDGVNPAYIEMGNILVEAIEDNKDIKDDHCVAFVNDNIKVHLLDISQKIPRYIIETKYERTSSRNLYSPQHFAEHLTKVEK